MELEKGQVAVEKREELRLEKRIGRQRRGKTLGVSVKYSRRLPSAGFDLWRKIVASFDHPESEMSFILFGLPQHDH